MRKVFIFLISILTFIGILENVMAGVVKWSQPPRMDQYGYDFSSETQVPSKVADDYFCESGLPVIGITWWGSYWNSGNWYPYNNSNHWGDPANVPPGTVNGFIIRFYKDVPAGTSTPPWSHPGDLLYEERLDFNLVNEKYYGQIDHADGELGVGTDIIETVFQYHATLPSPFDQQADNIYWLSIQAIDHDGMPIQWGWHEAENLWHDNAVQWGTFFNGGMENWNILTDKDMAFQIEVVPIPTTLLLLGTGLLSILVLKRKSHLD